MDILIAGYENNNLALKYGAKLRECIHHQSIVKYILESEHMKKFFDYVQLHNFDIASDAAATFKELLTRHKSTVVEFLSKNDETVSQARAFRLKRFMFLSYLQPIRTNPQILLVSWSQIEASYLAFLLILRLRKRMNNSRLIKHKSSKKLLHLSPPKNNHEFSSNFDVPAVMAVMYD